jgi:phenylacetate-CoA ligase
MASKDRTQGYFKPEETLAFDDLIAYQNDKLSKIISHAYENAPAFKKIMDSVGAKPGDIARIEDLERLPVTEKADLVELQAADPPFGGFVTQESGKLRRIFASPGPIYEPWPHRVEDDRWAEALFGAGFREGDRGAVTFSFHLAPFGFMLDAALEQVGVASLPTGVGNTELQIDIFKNIQVEAVCATPSFLNTIAQRTREMGLDPGSDLNLQAAFVAAEMLPESLRESLELDFGMTVRQAYGTADVGCLGYECFHKGGMHFPVDCIVEIVDPDTGKRLGPGEIGEVVATNFDPLYPLIRFGTGDLSSYSDEVCDCGRTTGKLTGIKGRVDQVTKVKGMFIHPGQVDQVGAKFAAISSFRVVVTRENQQDIMTFQAELKDDSADQGELTAGLKAAMVDILRLKGEVEFVAPGSIPEDSKKVVDDRVWD